MLVKKRNPEWKPSENPDLKVGETIDITDPKALIINGDVAALDDSGNELSPYDLYGVMVKDELDEFKQFLAIKKAESEKARLEKEKAALETELNAAKPAPAPVEATPKEEPKVEAKKK